MYVFMVCFISLVVYDCEWCLTVTEWECLLIKLHVDDLLLICCAMAGLTKMLGDGMICLSNIAW